MPCELQHLLLPCIPSSSPIRGTVMYCLPDLHLAYYVQKTYFYVFLLHLNSHERGLWGSKGIVRKLPLPSYSRSHYYAPVLCCTITSPGRGIRSTHQPNFCFISSLHHLAINTHPIFRYITAHLTSLLPLPSLCLQVFHTFASPTWLLALLCQHPGLSCCHLPASP